MFPAAIGPFQIERELGRGGMGEVFLARDSRLERHVAIKALPGHLRDDPDRLARFQREAKVLAMLNHPGIAAIHGLEEVGGRQYLILEFVEGETLADRLARGPIPVDEAIGIARQIAEALEAAHEKGVVHRDLKPGNVMVTGDGLVKVLDFGLARTEERGSSMTAPAALVDSPTVVAPVAPHSPTIPGAIMGTAGYMSPEQARGKPVDKRSDNFSFGCVLYEMLSGSQAFSGETVTDSLGAVLHRDPDWSKLPRETPALVQMLLRRCLTKDRKGRLHDIGDARVDLESAIKDPTGTSVLLPSVVGSESGRSKDGVRGWYVAVAGAALVVGGAIGWIARGTEPLPSAPAVVRFDIEPEAGSKFPSFGEGFPPLCVSPAGDKIVYGTQPEGKRQLLVRDVSEGEPRPIANASEGYSPFFSPDGRWMGFFSNGAILKVPIAGGPAVTLCPSPRSAACWLSDGTILGTTGDGVRRVSDQGGTPVLLAAAGPTVRTADGSTPVLGMNRVEAVPGADYVLVSIWDGDTLETYSVVAVSLKDGAIRAVLKNATDCRFVAPDRLVFLRDTSLMAAPFDAARGVVTGEAVQVVDSVRTTRWADAGYWAVSGGTLAYAPGGRMGPGRKLIGVDATGKSVPLMDEVDSIVGGVRVSPDGKFVAVVTLRRRIELWVYDLERRTMTLVNSEGESWQPIWSPDSQSLIFTRVIPGKPREVVRKPVRGGGPAETLLIRTPREFYPGCISPDGANLFLMKEPSAADTKERFYVCKQPKFGSADAAVPEPVTLPSSEESQPRISPDGRHLAYVSRESDRWEVFVRDWGAPTSQRVRISTLGGREPCWSRDGKHLSFIDPQGVMFVADLEAGEDLRLSIPRRLFDLRNVGTTAMWGVFDILADGSYVMVQPAPWESEPGRLRVVLNWDRELRQLALPAPKK